MTVISATSPTVAAAPLADGALVLHRSPVLGGVSRCCEALGRVLLEADFEPLVFFVGVFFLWVDKQLHHGAATTMPFAMRLLGAGMG